MGAYRDGRSQWRNRLPHTLRGGPVLFFEKGKGGETHNEKKDYRGVGVGHDAGTNV